MSFENLNTLNTLVKWLLSVMDKMIAFHVFETIFFPLLLDHKQSSKSQCTSQKSSFFIVNFVTKFGECNKLVTAN